MMISDIKKAIDAAKQYAGGDEFTPSSPSLAASWALIAIAEALLEERKRAEFQEEINEMRQERESNQRLWK